MPKGSRKLLFLVAVLLGADQLSKILIRIWLEPLGYVRILPFLKIEHIRNRGIAFGMMEGQAAVIIFTSSVVIVLLLLAAVLARRDGRWTWPFALIMAGSVGNLFDRIYQGSVTDFIRIPYWPAFNLADIFIVTGVALMAWQLLFKPARAS